MNRIPSFKDLEYQAFVNVRSALRVQLDDIETSGTTDRLEVTYPVSMARGWVASGHPKGNIKAWTAVLWHIDGLRRGCTSRLAMNRIMDAMTAIDDAIYAELAHTEKEDRCCENCGLRLTDEYDLCSMCSYSE